MSQSRTEAGQSMEEILASIRRIIAEGERDAQEGDAQRDRTEPTALPSSKPATAENSEAAGHAEVLVLTEMVQDDGSVVSLQSPVASAPAQPDETSVDSLLRQSLLAGAAPSSAASVSIATAIEAVEIVFEPKLAPPPETPAAQPTAAAESGAKPKPADALPDKLPSRLSPTPPPTDEERIPVSSESFKKPELVSEEALAASTAALAQLAQSVTRTREPAPGASKTLEELVRESVEPLLKQWLDQHLPRIVERMVREAIDRVVRRVE
jgi:cell pole-organizing protein PopZ